MNYETEIDKLVEFFDNNNLPYEVDNLFDGYIFAFPSRSNRLWDVICHSGSYGHELGLLEAMGTIIDDDYGEVEGYLTADEIIKRFLKNAQP